MNPRGAARAGFTMIELLIAFTTLGILIGMTLPAVTGAVARADAVKVVADVRTVQFAVLELEATTGSLPAPGGWGVVPAELRDLLPDGFQFSHKALDFAWSTLDQGAPASASVPGRYERYLGLAMIAPGGASGGQGQAKGKGKGGGSGSGVSEPAGPSETTPTAGSSDSNAVGVLWVRFDATDPVAGALQAHTSATAVWSPTQMMFLVTR